jgi:pimeloyl-ACP methyl ester carboxylesterase
MEQHIAFLRSKDKTNIAYALSGQGPPLVRAGTWLTHVQYDWESPLWTHWLHFLSSRHTLVRYDPRGCGLSDRDVRHFGLDAWVRDLEAVVEAAGLARFALLGMSQGAAIAIAYASRHPERVERLLLYGGYVRGILHRGRGSHERDELNAMTRLIELGWGRENPAFRQMFTLLFVPDGAPDEIESFNRLQQMSASPQGASRMARAFADIDVQGLAAQVCCPTLVMHCHGDARVPFDEGKLIASLIGGARFVPLQSRNHVLLAHEPAWETFVVELRGFLNPPSPRGASLPSAHLTPRERELLELIAEGRDNDDIASRLHVSNKTVRNHITRIFSKMCVTTRAQAIVRAREAGFGTGAAP